jgi:phosphomannomutase
VIAEMEASIKAGSVAVVGFEANGGFLLGQDITRDGKLLCALPTRDAILPMLSLLAMAHDQRVPLSGLMNALAKRFTASDRIKSFSTDRSRALIEALSSHDALHDLLGNLCGELDTKDMTDGLRMKFKGGDIVHLRPSGNAPELRCYAEADNESRAQALVAETLSLVATKY